jgi:hypothetical protein
VKVNPIRSLGAVLGGLGVISLVVEALEFSLVTAASGGRVTDMGEYFAVRNQTGILAAKLVYNTVAAVLGGYVTARVAMADEMRHAAAAAAAQTAALVWGFTAGEFASYTPIWMRIALVILMGPAMMVGAAVRARAAREQIH